jgi:hypothetical protein
MIQNPPGTLNLLKNWLVEFVGMKNFVDYMSRKCFASARVAVPRLKRVGYAIHSHSQNIIFWTSNPNNYSLNLHTYYLTCLQNIHILKNEGDECNFPKAKATNALNDKFCRKN